MRIKLVRQEDANGCVIASLAMVMGRTYQEVKADICPKIGKYIYPEEGKPGVWVTGINPAVEGICFIGDGNAYLIENGYALQTKYRWLYSQERETWPVEPWADVHIMCVCTSQSHATVLLGDKTVLDPLYDAPRRMEDYQKIENITAVWKTKLGFWGR